MPAKFPAWVWLLSRLFLGTVFAYAGYSKLMEPVENFRGVLTQYPLIPYSLTPVFAVIMPWIELIFGIFLLTGYATRLSALVLSGLSLVFFIVLAVSHFFLGQAPADCGCFGQGGIHLTTWQMILLDLLDASIGLKLFSMKRYPWSLDEWLKK